MYAPVPPVVSASRVNICGVLPLSTTDEISAAVWTKTRTVLPAGGLIEKVAAAVVPPDALTAADGPFFSGTARAAGAHAIPGTRAATSARPTRRGRRVRLLRGTTRRR